METAFNRIRRLAVFLSQVALLFFLFTYCWKNINEQHAKTCSTVSCVAGKQHKMNLHYAPMQSVFVKYFPLSAFWGALNEYRRQALYSVDVSQPPFFQYFSQSNIHLLSFINAP